MCSPKYKTPIGAAQVGVFLATGEDGVIVPRIVNIGKIESLHLDLCALYPGANCSISLSLVNLLYVQTL